MPLIPIRTETPIRRTPSANIALILINVAVFALTHGAWSRFPSHLGQSMMLATYAPEFHQFLTYQFLHANLWHLGGNMLCLWVFGNSVNGKMGHGPYVMFYLASGVFAALGFALIDRAGGLLVGASGAIAGVTTAYLALFPLSRVIILSLVIVIGFFRVPAMVLIVIKIILWDNLIGPRLGGPDHVAYSAHLSGYAFGFAGGVMMLLSRGVQRDADDILAVWRRAWQRLAYRRAVAREFVSDDALGGRIPRRLAVRTARDDSRLDRIMALREQISSGIAAGDLAATCDRYEELLSLDPEQVLPERQQLQVARACYEAGRAAQAAAAYERFLQQYPASPESPEVALLLGIIYARDLDRPDRAEKVLTDALTLLSNADRRRQCEMWLEEIRRRRAWMPRA